MRFVWGEPRVAEQYGEGVTETEVRLVDTDDKVLPYGASGKAIWKAVDYKDKLPVVGSLRDHLPLEHRRPHPTHQKNQGFLVIYCRVYFFSDKTK